MVLEAASIKAKLTVTWEPLPANFVLPEDPVENTQQPSLALLSPMHWEPQDLSSQKC